jgi:hypothetical protein
VKVIDEGKTATLDVAGRSSQEAGIVSNRCRQPTRHHRERYRQSADEHSSALVHERHAANDELSADDGEIIPLLPEALDAEFRNVRRRQRETPASR